MRQVFDDFRELDFEIHNPPSQALFFLPETACYFGHGICPHWGIKNPCGDDGSAHESVEVPAGCVIDPFPDSILAGADGLHELIRVRWGVRSIEVVFDLFPVKIAGEGDALLVIAV